MKISVIVPVYKVENYIGKCIQSLLDQTHTNFEALIVDDGSPDRSIDIAKEMVGNDPRFIFLEKENGGLSRAGHYGLDHATGDYIAFLESDDWLKPTTFQLCCTAFQPDVDVVLFGIEVVNEQGNIQHHMMPDLRAYYAQQDILLLNETINFSVWNKMYRQSVWQHRRFVTGLIYEDKELMGILLYQKKMVVLNTALYCYVQRTGSIMNSYHQNTLNSLQYIYGQYHKFLVREGLFDQYKDYYQRGYIKYCLYSVALQVCHYEGDARVYREDVLMKLETRLISIKNIIHHYGLMSKYTIVSVAFLLMPRMFAYALKKWRHL